MTHRISAAWISLALFVVLLAGPASAFTICIAPCGPVSGLEPIEPVLPIDLALLDPGAAGISGIVLEADGPGVTFNTAGSVVIHVPSGVLAAPVIDLRADGDIDVSILFDVGEGGLVNLCAGLCEPFGAGEPTFTVTPFHVTVLGPLTSGLRIASGGSISITQTPVPEPSTALLLGLGLVALVRNTRR